MNSGSALAAILSPIFGGWIIDVAGNWDWPFNGSTALMLVDTLFAFTMKPRRDSDPRSVVIEAEAIQCPLPGNLDGNFDRLQLAGQRQIPSQSERPQIRQKQTAGPQTRNCCCWGEITRPTDWRIRCSCRVHRESYRVGTRTGGFRRSVLARRA